jgi:pectate lyase
MSRKQLIRAIVLSSATLTSLASGAAPLAFPDAEGFGATATGGRGGEVYHVTNLNNDGPGSFRDAVSLPNRTVVFDVAGVINVDKQVAFSNNLTVAGQSAPGGITILGAGISLSEKSNVIVRYLTVRSGIKSGRGSKSFNINNGNTIIADHLSIGWGRWDNAGVTGKDSHDITIQNCLIHEAIKDQQFGMLVDNARRLSMVRNLWSNNRARNPKGKGDLQYINNVIYNWGNQGFGGGHSGAPWNQDLVGNYMIAGPDSNESFFNFANENDRVYSQGNFVDLDKDGTLNGRAWTEADVTRPDPRKKPAAKAAATTQKAEAEGDGEATPKLRESATAMPNPYNEPPVAVRVTSAEKAVADVIAGAGNSIHRDAVDQRQIDQLKSFGTLGKNPLDENEVGGNPQAPESKPAPADDDGDGIPNAWETAHGLNPNDAVDGNTLTADGYTQLEVYLNSLARSKSSQR